jgi:hypothetical protein
MTLDPPLQGNPVAAWATSFRQDRRAPARTTSAHRTGPLSSLVRQTLDISPEDTLADPPVLAKGVAAPRLDVIALDGNDAPVV